MISFVIAARDAAPSIGAAVRSALAQPWSTLEVVVVDDGSADATAARARAVGDDRVRVLQIPRSGRGAARNAGAANARGEFLAILDADDVALPGRLTATAAVVEATGAQVVSGQAVFLDPRLGPWELTHYPRTDAEIRAWLRSGRMPFCHSGCLILKDDFDRVGGYDPGLVRAQDLDLMRRLADAGAAFANTDDRVAVYRHPVVLPFAYWKQSRRWSRVVSGLPVEPPAELPAKYAGAMLKRGARFAHTRGPMRAIYHAVLRNSAEPAAAQVLDPA